jgi:hypothetical protein
VSLKDNQTNSQNDQILACVQKFMKNLNNKMEDFEYHNAPSSDDESHTDMYDISGRKAATQKKEQLMKSQEMQETSKSNTMKNNFMNVVENEVEEQEQKQSQNDFWNEKEEGSSHPLKGKFMESFEEISKSRSKFQISQNLNFIRLILCDSSVKDFSQGFQISNSEFESIVYIMAIVLKVNDVSPLEISETFDKLKHVRLSDGNVINDSVNLKIKIILREFTEHMHDVAEIGHYDILNEFYKLLNSYTIDLKKVEISHILNEVDFCQNQLDRLSFKVHFQWFTSQILGDFFFLKDIEPCIPLLVT